MTLPRLTIDLDAVTQATERLAADLRARGLTLVGVTKCVDGEPAVGRTMLEAGAEGLADSRLPSLVRLAGQVARSAHARSGRRSPTNWRLRRWSPTACCSATRAPPACSESTPPAPPSRSC